jgi:hypothetical protein
MRATLLCAAAVVIARPAFAHHGSGTFELNKTCRSERQADQAGVPEPARLAVFRDHRERRQGDEASLRDALGARPPALGWSPELFKIGEKGGHHRLARSRRRGVVLSADDYFRERLADGSLRAVREGAGGGVKEIRGAVKVVNTANRPARRPSGEPNISGDWAPEQVVMADPRGVGGGLVRLSTIPQDPAAAAARGSSACGESGWRRSAWRGAARGWRGAGRGPRAVARVGRACSTALRSPNLVRRQPPQFKPEDNPRFKCETTSIIFDWTFDGPVNRITQSKDTIVIQYGPAESEADGLHEHDDASANVKLTRAVIRSDAGTATSSLLTLSASCRV